MPDPHQYNLKKLPQRKPLLLFDGDCHFCRYWINRWEHHTEEKVEYEPYQSHSLDFPEIPIKEFEKSVHLILPTGEVYSGVEAVFRALAQAPKKSWSLWLYQRLPLFRPLSEFFYGLVARHRIIFSKLTRLIWGSEISVNDYIIARWLFLRVLGVIYLMAFLSLGSQVLGLYGKEGILPVEMFLNGVADQYGNQRFWLLPSVFWVHSGDLTLKWVCYGGAAVSGLLVLGVAPALSTFVLWGLYLSLLSVGRTFLSFQWDILLLEVGFLAIFLSPLQLKPNAARIQNPPRVIMWLLWLLLFKLMFSSGMVKLLSQDKAWWNLTALNIHYETQPIPNWISWFVHQLPGWFQKISTVIMFFIELMIPFLVFGPRRIRYFASLSIIFFMVLILVTGNYCFFNWLTIALCLLLFDDSFWPKKIRLKLSKARDWSPQFRSPNWPRLVTLPVFVIVAFLTLATWPPRIGIKVNWPSWVRKGVQTLNPFHLVSNYGLFAVMTTKRPEIIVEGSNDGQNWLAYEFKYKPGDLRRRPPFVAPHQPRLDWQMWFAALGTVQRNPWFVNFCARLMQGSKDVLDLMEKNPFPDAPPRFIRATMHDYHFTNFDEKRGSGNWWKRDQARPYLQPISLRR